MGVLNYLVSNLKWTFNKDSYKGLLSQPIAESSLYLLINRNCEIWQKYCNHKAVNLFNTEFCLNEIALSVPQNKLTMRLKGKFNNYWQQYIALKQKFSGKDMLFVADKVPRIEECVQLFVSATQLNYTQTMWEKFKTVITKNLTLESNEQSSLDNMLILWRIRYYCALYQLAQTDPQYAEHYFCNIVECNELLNNRYVSNDYYSKTVFSNGQLVSVLDCLGNSAVIAQNRNSAMALGMRVLCNGRNIFDTFCNHKYGKNTANLMSANNSIVVNQQYYLVDNCEVRNVFLQGKVKGKRNYTVEIDCQIARNGVCEVSNIENMHIIGLGGNDGYVGVCLVRDSKILPVVVQNNSNLLKCRLKLSHTLPLKYNQGEKFEIVTAYADSIDQLHQTYRRIQCYGYTHCPHAEDFAVEGSLYTRPTGVCCGNNLFERFDRDNDSGKFSFNAKVGDSVCTLIDKADNTTTLIDGFAFGIGGEKIFSVANSKITQLNKGKIELNGQTLGRKTEIDGNKIEIAEIHEQDKQFVVNSDSPHRVLFMFDLEEKSQITYKENVFHVKSKSRSFDVVCQGVVESFTTNAIECNLRRMRYKLSGDLSQGDTLCICFASSNSVRLTLVNCNKIPESQPVIKESLLSTYLNYINNKNIFLLSNGLRKPNALALAGISYSNSGFVKKILDTVDDNGGIPYCYYNSNGEKYFASDRLGYALALAYYWSVKADSVKTPHQLRLLKQILSVQYDGKDKCIQALAVKKLVQLNIDKVEYLIKYSQLKKEIMTDKSLYAYAQAIGAVELINASKQRLKDLCNTYGVEKCWYYVSQVENLYGIKLYGNALSVTPNVSQDNVLESLVLCLDNRRIETSFEKCSVQQIVINGNTSFGAINTQKLNQQNTLTIRY